MKKILLMTFLLANSTAFAQSPSPLNEDLNLRAIGTSGAMNLSWMGKTGRTYFMQTSQTLMGDSWGYLPIIEIGTGARIQWGFVVEEPSLFIRLQHTDQTFTGAVGDADFDGDGLSNIQEMLYTLTNPLVRDTDGDGLDDGRGSADSDQDGISDALEITHGTNPLDANSSAFALTGLRVSTLMMP